jgi:hypothetical protein
MVGGIEKKTQKQVTATPAATMSCHKGTTRPGASKEAAGEKPH